MPQLLLSILLSVQLICSPAPGQVECPAPAQESRLWWGLIDPELSLWFSRLPLEETEDAPVLWDFSWRGFLATLFGHPLLTEEVSNAAHA